MTNPSQPTSTPSNTLLVSVRDPERVYFEGKVTALSSINQKGPFDILSLHENFITLIKEKITLHLPDGTDKDILITQGVLKVQKNAVYIFLELATLLGKTG